MVKTYRYREPVPDEYICVCCFEVMEKPYRLPCKHSFCGTCITTWTRLKRSCPLCRKRFTRPNIKLDDAREKAVHALDICCPHAECLWFGPRDQLDEHLEECRLEQSTEAKVNQRISCLLSKVYQTYGDYLREFDNEKLKPLSLDDYIST